MAAKQKISTTDKQNIVKIFKDDFKAIEDTLLGQVRKLWQQCSDEISKESGLTKRLAFLEKLERDIAAEKAELQRVREEMQAKISRMEKDLVRKREEKMGEFDGSPDVDQLIQLGFGHDTPIEGRSWNGFPIRNRLDAMVAIRLMSKTDVTAPFKAIETIGRAVERALAFAATYDDVAQAYEHFHSLNFQQFGVEIPPLLGDMKKLSGDRLLGVGVQVDESRLLAVASSEQK